MSRTICPSPLAMAELEQMASITFSKCWLEVGMSVFFGGRAPAPATLLRNRGSVSESNTVGQDA